MGLSQFLQFSPTFNLTDMLSDILKDFLAAWYLTVINRTNNLYHDWQKLRHSLLAP
jgi:hypothetical protein